MAYTKVWENIKTKKYSTFKTHIKLERRHKQEQLYSSPSTSVINLHSAMNLIMIMIKIMIIMPTSN